MKRERAEKLFNLLGEIDDKIIAEADVGENKSSQIIQFNRKRNMTRFATIAASIAFLVVSVWGVGQFGMDSDGDEMAGDWVEDDIAMSVPEADWSDVEEEAGTLGFAPELLINEEIATMFPYEVSVSLLGELILIETFPENTEIMYFKQSTIEYFDGSEWFVVVNLKDLFPIGVDYEGIGVGVVSSSRTYEFSWITDAGFDIEDGLFRIRQRWSFTSDFTVEGSHDLVIEFNLKDVGTTLRNLDIVDELKFNSDFSEVVLNVDIPTTGTILTGTIINHSDTSISPSHPSLEYFNGTEWRYVPTVDYLAFEDIGFTIMPRGTHEFNVDLNWYIIPEGYPLRLRKTVWPDGSWPYGWNQTYLHHDLVYEFEIIN